MVGDRTYQDLIADWQQEKETSLRAEDSWLTIVGLHWLQDGENTIGSAADNTVQLPPSTPAHFGVIDFHDGVGILRTNEPHELNGATLNNDSAKGGATIVRVGTVNFFLIFRDGQIAVRVRDNDSETRMNFAGRVWFPVNSDYRVQATFTAHPTERFIEVENSAGKLTRLANPGYVEFTLQGQLLTLQAFEGGPDSLWFVFRDGTSGKETYGAGRFMYAHFTSERTERTLDMDFNQSYHPPCAFTPFATCPFPPRENILPFPIPVGERYAAK